MNREKVEVARAQPIAPSIPEVQEALPVPEPIDPIVETDGTSAAATKASAPRAQRRPLIRYYGGGIASGILLLLAAITAGFWVHSFGAIDRAIYATSAGTYYWIESYRGAIYFHTERDPSPVARQLDFWRVEFGDPWAPQDPPPALPGAAFQGVAFKTAVLPGGQTSRYSALSYWILVTALALPSVWWLRQRKRLAARCRRLRCLDCGRRLSSLQDQCPACGSPAPVTGD